MVCVAGMPYYGNKYWGITEANYLLVILHCMTGFFGPHMWRADVASLLGVKLPFTLVVNDCLLMFVAFFAVSYSLAAFYRVLRVDQVRTSNNRSVAAGVMAAKVGLFYHEGSLPKHATLQTHQNGLGGAA